jgi:Transposase/SWIM zinc finger
VATSATGKGVSVLDFLCINQTKDMMRAVLSFFIDNSPRALAKIRSFVIDKDYREWQVLEELFPNTRVVLCQFHVLQCFKRVVTSGKYEIDGSIRDDVLKSLRALVYARSVSEYEHQQRVLDGLLTLPTHDEFKTYLDSRWHAIRAMWSSCERGQIFTATNTTSNRIESNWNQLKSILGKKTRIDKCVEAIFKHATFQLRRDSKLYRDFEGTQLLHCTADPFMKPLLVELSNYSSQIVVKEWEQYLQVRSVLYATQLNDRTVAVKVTYPRVHENLVDVHVWSCTCNSFRTSHLPCKHLIFVVKDVLECPSYPVQALPERWRMSEAGKMLPSLVEAIKEMESLRLSQTLDISGTDIIDLNGSEEATGGGERGDAARGHPSVLHVKLRRREQNNCVVLSDIEKRNLVDSKLESVRGYLMRQGSVKFTACTIQLGDVLDRLLEEWRGVQLGDPDNELNEQEQVRDESDEEEEYEQESGDDLDIDMEGRVDVTRDFTTTISQSIPQGAAFDDGPYSPPPLGGLRDSSTTKQVIQAYTLSRIGNENFFCTPSPPPPVQRRLKFAPTMGLLSDVLSDEEGAQQEVDTSFAYDPDPLPVNHDTRATRGSGNEGAFLTPSRKSRSCTDSTWYKTPTTRASAAKKKY